MAYGSLLRILDTRDRLETERDFWRTLSLSLIQVADDLAQVRPRTVRGPDGLTKLPAFHGQAVDSRALGEPSLEFTRGGQIVLGDGARSDLQRVGYQLRDGTLSRLGWAGLGRAPGGGTRAAPRRAHSRGETGGARRSQERPSGRRWGKAAAAAAGGRRHDRLRCARCPGPLQSE